MLNEHDFLVIHKFIVDRNYDEREYFLRVFDVILSREIFQEIKNISEIIRIQNLGKVTLTGGEVEVDIDLSNEYKDLYENLNVIFKIDKNKTSEKYFFTEKGFETFLLSENALENEYLINVYFSKKSISSKKIIFKGSELDLNHELSIRESERIIASKFVRPLNVEGQKLLPSDIILWLTNSEDVSSCELTSWKKISTTKLLLTLCAEIIYTPESIELFFRGERRIAVKLLATNLWKLDYLFEEVNICADWVFSQSKDIDTRHTIFNHQFSMLIKDASILDKNNDNYKKIFHDAIENSKLAYRYYLQNISKELLKTLTELNKTLSDLVTRIRQNTIDLINNLWKDLTTVLGLLMLNFSIKKPDLPEVFYDFLGCGLSVYLVLSIFLNARMSFWYYNNLKHSLNDWKNKLYSYLSKDDWEGYLINPLRAAQSKYRSTFFIVLILYIIMILAVLFFTVGNDIVNLTENQ